MNKRLVFFAGLASLTLTYAPAALANASMENTVNRSSPAPMPPNAGFLPEIRSDPRSNIQPNIQLGIQPNIQPSPQNYPEPLLIPFPTQAPITSAHRTTNPYLPARIPADNEGYIPLAPAAPLSSDAHLTDAQSSDAQFAMPIPSDLGLHFDLSNSATSRESSAPPSSPTTPPASILSPVPVTPPPQLEPTAPPTSTPLPKSLAPAKPTDFTLGDLFTGGSDSLVAIVVGSAEGTRSPDGQPNESFYGHSDPGNGVWNLGTFSYQHGATSPAEADEKQLKRLKQQAQVIQEKAVSSGLKLTLEETLNGIDLVNQAPKAVIDAEGYVEWLMKAHQMGKTGDDAILWARVQSFIDPKTQRWDAPGLGNTADNIIHDQQRRMKAIDRAIAAQNYQIASDARLRPQPIGFRLPRWHLAGQLIQKVATLFH